MQIRAPTDYETAAVNEYVRNPEFRKAVANIYRRKLEKDKRKKMSTAMTLKMYTKSAALYLVNNGMNIALLTGAMATANAAATRAAHVHNEIGVVDIALHGFNQAVGLYTEGPVGLARAAWPAARQIGEIRLRHRFEMFVNNNQPLSDLRNWTQRHLDSVHQNITNINPGEALHRFNPIPAPAVNQHVPETVIEGIRLQSRYPQRNPFAGQGRRLGDSMQTSQAANDAIKNMGRVPADDRGLGMGEFDQAPEPIPSSAVAPDNEWRLPGGADDGLGLGIRPNPTIRHLHAGAERSIGMQDERVREADLQRWIFDDSGSNLVRAPPGAQPDGLIRNLPEATPVAPRAGGFRGGQQRPNALIRNLPSETPIVPRSSPAIAGPTELPAPMRGQPTGYPTAEPRGLNWNPSGRDITAQQATDFRLDVGDAAPAPAFSSAEPRGGFSFRPFQQPRAPDPSALSRNGLIGGGRGAIDEGIGLPMAAEGPSGPGGNNPFQGDPSFNPINVGDPRALGGMPNVPGQIGADHVPGVHPYARYQQGHFQRGTTFSGNMINKMLAKGGRTASLGRFLVDHGNKVTAGFRVGGAAVAAAGIVYSGVRMQDMHKYRDELRSIATDNPEDEQIQEFFKINDEATKRNDVYFGVNTAIGAMGIASGVAGAATAVGGGAALVAGGAAAGSAIGTTLGTGAALAVGEGAAAGAMGAFGAATGAAAGAAAGEMGAAALATLAGPVGWAALGLGVVVGGFTMLFEHGKKKAAYREYLSKLYGNSSAPSLDYYLDHKDPDLLHAVNGAKNYQIKDDATDDFRTYMEGVQSQIKSAEGDIKIEEGVDDPRRQQLAEILQQTVPPGELDKTSDFISRQHAQDVQNGQPTRTWSKADIKDHANRQFKSDHDRYESQDQSPDKVNMTDQDVYNYNDKMNHTETLRFGYGKVEGQDQPYSKQEVTDLENRNTEAAANRQGRM